jgi:predicted SAM-dependent methyltransferase
MLFGGQADAHDFHRVGLTHEILGDFLRRAGFARIERVETFDLFADASAGYFRDTLVSVNVVAYR